MKENKEVMAANIKYYMERKKVNSADVCKALGFKQNTFSNWINAKIYPRIDKIEMMARYFGISKSDLVEERTTISDPYDEMESNWYDLVGGKQPVTREEIDLIIEYRDADDDTKKMIKRLLEYGTRIKELMKDKSEE